MDSVDMTETLHTKTDTWRIEATFSHLALPVVYNSGKSPFGKQEAYMWAARWLMSENIQRIQIYKGGALHQTITVEVPDA